MLALFPVFLVVSPEIAAEGVAGVEIGASGLGAGLSVDGDSIAGAAIPSSSGRDDGDNGVAASEGVALSTASPARLVG